MYVYVCVNLSFIICCVDTLCVIRVYFALINANENKFVTAAE